MSGQLIDPQQDGGAAGQYLWGMSRTNEGHRDFSVTHRVRTSDVADGPHTVFQTPGLPLTGDIWGFGNDLDFWAICQPKLEIKRFGDKPGHPGNDWTVTNHYSTKPITRCQDEEIEDPLLIPQDISGSFVNSKKLATQDKDGVAIHSSTFERLNQPELEFEYANATVKIGQNVAALQLSLFTSMINTVNDAPLWGMSERSVKLSNVSWERLVKGTCDYYYRRTFEFDIDFQTFDRTVYDRGRRELKKAGLDITDPKNYKLSVDDPGNPSGVYYLDGQGNRVDGFNAMDNAHKFTVQYYQESNFLQLGIPTTL